MTRILLVDDHQTFLAGTKMILEKHGFIITTSYTSAHAIELFKENEFDLFLYDLNMPNINGFELSKETLMYNPEARIVILTGEEIIEYYDSLIELGIVGLIEKAMNEEELVMSLQLALKGKLVLPLQIARQLRTKLAFSSSGEKKNNPSKTPLKENEVEILNLVAQGLKNKEIAGQLFMSQRNVEYILSHLFNKLQVNSRQEAVLKAMEMNLLKVD